MTGTSLHRKNALILTGVLVASIPFGAAVSASVALGGFIQIANLGALERSVSLMLGLAPSSQGAVPVLILFRFVALMGVCAAALIVLPVEPLAFAAGFSTSVPAVLWHGLRMRREV